MPNDPATIRSLIIHENEMINHRMTWFLVLQGFMLTGIAFGWEKSRELCGVFACIRYAVLIVCRHSPPP